jgi:hypothetical protein
LPLVAVTVYGVVCDRVVPAKPMPLKVLLTAEG